MPIITQCACALGAGRSSRPVSTIHERTPPQNVYAKCSVWKLYKGTLGWIPSRAWDDLPLIESAPRVCAERGPSEQPNLTQAGLPDQDQCGATRRTSEATGRPSMQKFTPSSGSHATMGSLVSIASADVRSSDQFGGMDFWTFFFNPIP